MVERVYTDRYMAGLFYRNIPIPYNHHNKYDWDDIPERHVFMSRVFCVPDKNNLPPIDGATATEGKTLAQDQVLQSQGFFLQLRLDVSELSFNYLFLQQDRQ